MKKLPLIFLLIITAEAVGVGLVAYRSMPAKNEPQQANFPSPSPISTSPTPTVAAQPTNPNIKTFSSSDLGIRFSYKYKYDDGTTVNAKQIGNKVYVYSSNTKPEQGQYVEVFQKDPNDSLIAAINKKFMTSYSASDCLVQNLDKVTTGTGVTLPSSYVFAEIATPGPNDDLEAMSAKAAKCPTPYTRTNGIAYFLMDKNHPSTFVFFSIGQYALDADNGKLWQDTITFTK